MLIYPAVDLRGGVCVRLLQGRFDAVTRYDEDPRARLETFAASGAEWVHIVDLDGAEAGAPVQHGLIGELVKATGMKVQTGGGVRTRDDVARLLDAGVSAVVVGSRAVSAPGEVANWLREFGPDRLTLALDVRIENGAPEVATHGWVKGSGVDLWSALDALSDGAPKRVLVTDVARDGALGGPNLDLMSEIVRRRPDIELQASGGVGKPEDIAALKATGAHAAIVGKAIYEGLVDLERAISDAG